MALPVSAQAIKMPNMPAASLTTPTHADSCVEAAVPSPSFPQFVVALERVGLPIDSHALWRALVLVVTHSEDLTNGAVACSLMAWLEARGWTERFSRDMNLLAALFRLLPRLQMALVHASCLGGGGGGGKNDSRDRSEGEEACEGTEAKVLEAEEEHSSEEDRVELLIQGVQAVWGLLHDCCTRLDGWQARLKSKSSLMAPPPLMCEAHTSLIDPLPDPNGSRAAPKPTYL